MSGLEDHIGGPDRYSKRPLKSWIDSAAMRSGSRAAISPSPIWKTLLELAPAINWKGDKDRVESLRVVKDASEVAQIREAIGIAERAFGMFRAMLRPEDSEKDLCDALERYIRRAGGHCTSFPSIVAVGERAALPHAPPTSKDRGRGRDAAGGLGRQRPVLQKRLDTRSGDP